MFLEKKIQEMGNCYKHSIDLIKIQEEYIELLVNYISEIAGFLHVHGIKCDPGVINKGEELRDKIDELKKEVFLK